MATKEQRIAWKRIKRDMRYKDKIIKEIIKLYKDILYKKDITKLEKIKEDLK